MKPKLTSNQRAMAYKILHRPPRPAGTEGKILTCFWRTDKPQLDILLTNYRPHKDKTLGKGGKHFFVCIKKGVCQIYGWKELGWDDPPGTKHQVRGYSNRCHAITAFIERHSAVYVKSPNRVDNITSEQQLLTAECEPSKKKSQIGQI